MHGARRVVIFCALTTILPITLLVIPLYLRHNLYADVVYAVTESDILEMSDGVSTIFCSAHTLQMNGTFNAFQMGHRPEVTSYRKHIRLKKSMTLPDDTLEYWGFYLLRGATVALSVCSRFPGASILVVKGERSLRTCGLLDHNKNKAHSTGIFLPEAHHQVKITFESNAQIIDFEEPKKTLTQVSNDTKDEYVNKNVKSRVRKMKNDNKVVNEEKIVDNEERLTNFSQESQSQVHRHIEKSQDDNIKRRLRHARSRHHGKKLNHKKHDKNVSHDENNIEKSRRRRNVDYNKDTNYENPSKRRERLLLLMEELNYSIEDESGIEIEETISRNINHGRRKRNQEPLNPPALLDHGIQHGGNAPRNSTDFNEESSVSSFEEGLFNCYEGQVLLAQEFEPSNMCTNVSYLINGKHMQTRHNVAQDGYYYYIFYSDNDFVFNDIHAVFDIYKPTFQYENVTKSCVNKTECTFPLSIMSDDRVIVEVPTKDGIDHEQDDISLLISICHPRMGIYIIFPIAVLFLILGCAFM